VYLGIIKRLAQVVDYILENLNIPLHALHTPIAADYVKFNTYPNYGEVVNAKL
jgi:hypothetical protein